MMRRRRRRRVSEMDVHILKISRDYGEDENEIEGGKQKFNIVHPQMIGKYLLGNLTEI